MMVSFIGFRNDRNDELINCLFDRVQHDLQFISQSAVF